MKKITHRKEDDFVSDTVDSIVFSSPQEVFIITVILFLFNQQLPSE